ncbi:MAG TPA: response regulator [Polyangiaceae bacterium]|nr:response regulator [Polyangiaceae bacterium]
MNKALEVEAPTKPARAVRATASGEPKPALQGRAPILTVDDHPANLVALEAVLEPLGLELVRSSSGEDALRQLLTREFALILLDVQMPGLDGFKTAQLIKERPRSRDVPIIFITALSRDTTHVFRGYSHGAVDYLLKPFDPDILRSKVAVFVELFLQKQKIREQEAELREREREAHEKQTQEQIRNLVDAMPLAVWATDTTGRVYYCNEVWTTYSGLNADRSGYFGIDAAHADDVDRVQTSILDAFGRGVGFETELRLRRADGHYRWHLLRAVPERNVSGMVARWIATATDIEERKRGDEARVELLAKEKEAREEAQQANRMKDEFLATVSHELRTPLTAILGWTRIIRGGKLDPPRFMRGLDVIERNGRAQAAIIDDILDVSRIITGKLRLELDNIDLVAVVRAAMDTVRPAAEAKGIALEWRSELSVQRFSGDPDRLQQIAWNLLSNAIKFTPKGGRVEIETTQVDSHIEVRVTDTGQGIAASFLPHVFDRFRQADGTSTRRHGGLGLGLAIVRHLVELHGGTVHVESEGEGHGATFIVRLPVRAVQGPARPVHRGAPIAVLGRTTDERILSGLVVLAVDDEADARELIATVLEQAGARTITVATADEALAVIARDRPDVFLSDIGMPGRDGFSLMRSVRALAPENGGSIPAAALTAYSRAEDARRAFEAGFQRHVPKPVDPDTLVAQVAALAGRFTPARPAAS